MNYSKSVFTFFFCIALISTALKAQDNSFRRDKGKFVNYAKTSSGDTTLSEQQKQKDSLKQSKKKHFIVDVSGMTLPTSPDEFTKAWYNDPMSQGKTGDCWSFATTSFFESEIYRLYGVKVKLSEMYFVYWKCIELAKYYVKQRGNVKYAEGSETNAVPRLMMLYGAVPYESYTGLTEGQTKYDHKMMIKKISDYLAEVKKTCAWNDSMVTANVKEILNTTMGEPPEKFDFKEKNYTPKSFLNDYCKLIPSDYYSFMSNNKFPFNKRVKEKEESNWIHYKEYYNISADDFISLVKKAIKEGYTISICGDVTEAGIDKEKQVAIVPTFDIPSEYIDDDARQMRISNRTTTDDHCLHLVGYKLIDNKYWFLVKDSAGFGVPGAKHPGYKYFSEDYVKLKIMNLLINKNAAKTVLDKIIK